jgi:hypothetical protein
MARRAPQRERRERSRPAPPPVRKLDIVPPIWAQIEQRIAAALAAELHSQLSEQFTAQCEANREFMGEEIATLRLDLERMIKLRVAEVARDVELKLAGLRMPAVRGTYSETQTYLPTR